MGVSLSGNEPRNESYLFIAHGILVFISPPASSLTDSITQPWDWFWELLQLMRDFWGVSGAQGPACSAHTRM